MSHPLPTVFYSIGGVGPLVPDLDQPDTTNSGNEPYLDFLHYMISLPFEKLPHTISISYGEDEQSVPKPYADLVCFLFAVLGGRGVSILVASGDSGPGNGCQTNGGRNSSRFNPIFPASCPWVTSVGGVYHVEPEIAIPSSSGGFSDYFARPTYQDKEVPAYLKILGQQWAGLYNSSGRGFPDIAAQSYNYSYFDEGKESRFGGTSVASPKVAALIALINSARTAASLPPLGFLNPWLYTIGRLGLNDIVNGGSRGCTGIDTFSGLPGSKIPYASWNATDGWDPVTGLGTLDFRKLLDTSF